MEGQPPRIVSLIASDDLRRVPAVARGRCHVLDGNAYFNRPGPRLADSAELLASVLDPRLFGDPSPLRRGRRAVDLSNEGGGRWRPS